MITLITTTGSRPEAFKLCEKFMARQTYTGEKQWIVIDDSPKNPTVCTMGQEYYVGPKEWKPGINTQRYSLDLAISKVKGDYVFIIEDDDLFKPQYLEVMLDFLKYADIVGECGVTYYSLKTKAFREMGNYQHASTTQTGFRKAYLPAFDRAVHSGERFFDILLWNTARLAKHKNILFSGMDLCIGMKGLPGRSGIGVGHQNNEFIADPHYVKLRQLMSEEDSKIYIDMMKNG